jgi:cyclohexadieny/prephenate dehydrogenase
MEAGLRMFKQVTLVGCGLIGSSIARVLKQKKLAETLCVVEKADVVARVQTLGLADRLSTKLSDVVPGSDLVILCTPIGTYESLANELASVISADAILTDVGSVKGVVITALKNVKAHVIPGHPIAGTENSGPESGFAELFHDRWWILTPPADADVDAVKKLSDLYTAFGARVTAMPADHHDQVLAMTSHLPHLIAYSIVDTCVKLEGSMQQEVIAFSASGFRDFTRIAASDPTMWRDVFLNNKEAVLEGLQRFTEDLMELQKAIRWSDGEKLFDVFSRTRAIRRSIIDQRQHIPEEDKKKR